MKTLKHEEMRKEYKREDLGNGYMLLGLGSLLLLAFSNALRRI
jgi:hypothetical protein